MLDNFETNLKPQAEPGTTAELLWACQDPAWDRCLARLATELVGTRSRVLITCRRPLAALAGTASHLVRLGPLPPGEAALYLREHAGLGKMVFGGDESEKALAQRLLDASRFHPLLMDRLARLATGGPALLPQLMQALDALEKSHDHSQLPALFATNPGDAKELAYLNDALATSLDQLIRDVSPDARRLLWMIAVANEPVTLWLLKGVWSGESHEQQQLRQIKQMVDMLPLLPPELQEKLKAMPPELRARIDALQPEAGTDPEPLLRHLVAVGLATEERTGPDDDDPDLTCHELVRERIRTWMRDHEQDRADLTENAIRLAYAERLEATFEALLARGHDRRPPGRQPRPGLLRPGRGLGPAGRFRRQCSLRAPAIPVCWRACSLTWKPPPSPPRRASRAGRASATSPMRCGTRAALMRACASTSRPPPRPAPPPRPEVKTRAEHGRISPGSPATGRLLS